MLSFSQPPPDAISYLEVLGATIGLGGLLFGVYQYTIAQKWKKAEFAAKQLLRLATNRRLKLCCRVLDWQRREFPVPDYYREHFESATFGHNWRDLAKAMKPETERFEFTGQQVLYRDLFDEFFEYLEAMNHFIEIGLVEQAHVSSLQYWLVQIARPRFTEEPVFERYLKEYGYEGVIRLLDKFGISFRERQVDAEHGS